MLVVSDRRVKNSVKIFRISVMQLKGYIAGTWRSFVLS
jgi:hypothetical protein